MVRALRQALRKMRKEKSSLEATSMEERDVAVEDVRRRMGEEVAKLKEALRGLEGGTEGATEREGMAEEMRCVGLVR